ncbi:hypothetical protein ACFQ8C_14730 [Streptomyces sp. NPDC056503]|uniref:hypothetical protein n=1 Tax=Streptomyces sp. NPDC056503 TaxID=3345842 RepID=UPI0036BCDE40
MSGPDAEACAHHPLLLQRVRDIASGGEGILTAVVHEWHGGRLVRIAHLRPADGAAWTTAADNIAPALRRDTARATGGRAPEPGAESPRLRGRGGGS